MQLRTYLALALAVTLLTGQSSLYGQVPVGSEFTYQGQLKDGGSPANGDYDFVFRLFDDPNNGAQIGSDFLVDDWPITDGLFTVQLDFGDSAFSNEARWLEVAVRPWDSEDPHTVLSPRQPVTAAPVALYALDGPGTTGLWEAVGDNIMNTNSGFVGINRTDTVTGAEYFGIQTPTGAGQYGGMYIRTDNTTGKPFYGYNTGAETAWTYFDGSTGTWKLYNDGDRITVEDDGDVGIGTNAPQARLDIAGTAKMDGFQLTGSPNPGDVLTSDANGVGTWQPSGGGGGFWAPNGDDIYNTNAGGVGIGTTTPASMLDVQSTEGTHGVMSSVPWIPVWAHRTGTTGTWPAVHGECDSEDPDGSAVRGIMTSSSSGLHSAGVLGVNSGSGYGVYGSSPGGIGVCGEVDSDWSVGVRGISNATGFGFGVYGNHAGDGWGVCGVSSESTGVRGETHGDWYTAGVHGHSNGIFGYGVHGTTDAGGVGVNGYAPSGIGVAGTTDSVAADAIGVYGVVSSTTPGSSSAGVRGQNNGTGGSGIGVYGSQDGSGWGVYGYTPSGRGVYGRSGDGWGVYGHCDALDWSGVGVRGSHAGLGIGVYGVSANGIGVYGVSTNGTYAGWFDGTVNVDVLEITGADVAEKFPVSGDAADARPGTVMEIDPENPGKLRVARGAYNRRVAGVVSGAGDIPTGTILGNLPGSKEAPPIALGGRVWVHCDASESAIETGDLLTTSNTPGHAMAVSDFSRAHGAVIGKAMTPLAQGETGMVLVLVNLQ